MQSSQFISDNTEPRNEVAYIDDDKMNCLSFNTGLRLDPLSQSITSPACCDVNDSYKIDVPPIIIPRLSLSLSLSDSSASFSDSDDWSSETTPSSAYDCADSQPITSSVYAIKFDTICGNRLIASTGFISGCHEWTIKVMKSDTCPQEIGIVSNIKYSAVQDAESIWDNSAFGARASYGTRMDQHSYYSSFNMNNSSRCMKGLAACYSSWCEGDEIRVHLDLDKGVIAFYLNDKQVRKSLSVQRNVMYYPIICFAGDCKYRSTHYDCSTF
eukprot:606518_1